MGRECKAQLPARKLELSDTENVGCDQRPLSACSPLPGSLELFGEGGYSRSPPPPRPPHPCRGGGQGRGDAQPTPASSDQAQVRYLVSQNPLRGFKHPVVDLNDTPLPSETGGPPPARLRFVMGVGLQGRGCGKGGFCLFSHLLPPHPKCWLFLGSKGEKRGNREVGRFFDC